MAFTAMRLDELTKEVKQIGKRRGPKTEPQDTPTLRDQREEKETEKESKEGMVYWKPSKEHVSRVGNKHMQQFKEKTDN